MLDSELSTDTTTPGIAWLVTSSSNNLIPDSQLFTQTSYMYNIKSN